MFTFPNKKNLQRDKSRRNSSVILRNVHNRRAYSFDTDNSLKLYEIPLNETKHYNSEISLANNSDNETPVIEYSTSKYEKLHNEIETVIVHRENSESSIIEICNEKQLFQSNNKHTKIKISLSQEQICNVVTGGATNKTNIKNNSTLCVTSTKNTIKGIPTSKSNINFKLIKDINTKNVSNICLLKTGKKEGEEEGKSFKEIHLKPPIQDDRLYNLEQSSINLALPISYNVQRQVSAPDINSKKVNDQLVKSNLFPHRSTSKLENTHEKRYEKQASDNDSSITNDDKLKCSICKDLFKDPRVLDCLHTFCFQCLINNDVTGMCENNQFWPKLNCNNDYDWNWKNEQNHSIGGSVSGGTSNNDSDNVKLLRDEKRSSFGSFRLRKHSKIIKNDKSRDQYTKSERNSSSMSCIEKPIQIICTICETMTELPMGGFCRLPENFVVSRLIQSKLSKNIADKKSTVSCSLCSGDASAISYCFTCKLNLCSFCKEAHARQRITAYHEVRLLSEIKNSKKPLSVDHKKESKNTAILCSIHPANELKLFCTICQQVACDDCTILIHRDHKCESMTKAAKVYLKLIRDSLEKTRPLNDYAILTISKLNGISKKITTKCDTVQKEVETYLKDYFDALEIHKKTLFNQIIRSKNNKMEAITCQQTDLEKRSIEAKAAIQFTDELLAEGSHVEILTFVNILLKRFEHCQMSKVSLDPKISDSLQFLPEIKAPSAKAQHNIPLFGIITTQTAIPKFCTLETAGLMSLRVHRKAELQVLAKDIDERPLCHGGLSLHVELKYRDSSGRTIQTQISDKRDGSYIITFTPDAAGVMNLLITIQGKPIKGSPFKLCARTLRPHCGIYHCCSFCSSGKSKIESCACSGIMPGGYKGCGHGHDGHPGRRHWSCCANVLENSECSKANTIVDVDN